jgi:hypothetical protein
VGPLAVSLKLGSAIHVVEHSPPHWDQQRLDRFHQTCLLQCMDSTLGQSQVNGLACRHMLAAHIGPVFKYLDPISPLAKHNPQQGSHQSSTHNRD